MYLVRLLFMLLLLCTYCPGAFSQIIGYRDVAPLTHAHTGWSQSDPDDTSRPHSVRFQVLRKYSDGTLDSSFTLYPSGNSGMQKEDISPAPDKTPDRVPLDVIVIFMRITDPKDFNVLHRYHILQNGQAADSGFITNKGDAKGGMFFLYETTSLGQKIDIYLYAKNGDNVGSFQYTGLPRPFLVTPFLEAEDPAFKEIMQRIARKDTAIGVPVIDWKHYDLIGPMETSFLYCRQLRRPIVLDIPRQRQPVRLFMYPLADTLAYEYMIVPEDSAADTIPWKVIAYGNPVITLPELKPGNYQVHIRYNRFNSESIIYHITIRTSYRRLVIGGILAGAVLLLITGTVLLQQKLRFRKRERRLKAERQLADLQNQVYRSQLNPHFIFNALSSIQSLMNKGEIPKANDYLSDFAGLLRHTLDAQKSEFWNLDDELNLLKNYVRLEQLRFSFRFELALQDGIVPVNHAFPAMLLQPVVENAIRHGFRHDAASLLTVHIRRTGTDLVIVIVDNGRGFDTLHVQQGDGLRLTHERITFLNRQGERWRFILQSGAGGTAATFTGKDYFQDDETRA